MCDLGFTDPVPGVTYADYSYGGRGSALWSRFARTTLKFAMANASPRSWLDFGAGSGDLVLAAKQAGLRSIGVEIDLTAQRWAQERGIALVSSLEALPPSSSFDVVSLSHVLEHLDSQVG